MTFVDTSDWIEFLRDTGSPVCQRVDNLPVTEIATCDVVRMEVLAGARDEQHLQQLRRFLARASTLPTEPVDYGAAAALYRACRQRDHTVRKLIHCLIAAVAIHGKEPVLLRDTDFDILAQHTPLQVDAG